MKRRGNILIMTLIACAMLALVLVSGLELASLKTASQQAQIASLQLEQLHRTAVDEALHTLNASGETVSAGRVLLSDEPLDGQSRLVSVRSVDGDLLTVVSESRLTDGGKRRHRVQFLALPLEERLGFSRGSRALYHAVGADVPARWLRQHTEEDLVIVCDQRPSRRYNIGRPSDDVPAQSGSLYVQMRQGDGSKVVLRTPLSLAGHAVFTGDLTLSGDLSCKAAWIDGTLTIGEDMRLTAETVTLGEDVDTDILARIEADTIYMPHPPEAADEDADQETGPTILPLPDTETVTVRTAYLMLQQLD